jgi:dimethylhistidine N-methyltransferase
MKSFLYTPHADGEVAVGLKPSWQITMQRQSDLQGKQTTSLSTVDSEFLHDVLQGLSEEKKFLPCKYLYDERGSQLFDRICELDEYYPTRTETQITLDNSQAIADCIGPKAILVEYGSGSSTKTRDLLDHLDRPEAYLPVDISADHLLGTVEKLQNEYPDLDVRPIVADFTAGFELPDDLSDQHVCVYFPGSTIGNFETPAAIRILRFIAEHCGPEGGLLIGFDLHKATDVLELAYDDPHGVTAEFSLNILNHINDELDANFDVSQFRHVSFYNQTQGRIEIYIESLSEQQVTIAEQEFNFGEGERIHVEHSHKYTIEGFAEMAGKAGLKQQQVWTDDQNYFALMYLTPVDTND